MALHPIWITDDAPPDAFPDVDYALLQPNGLLAVGGDLSPQRLRSAYRRGIFPWYGEGQPILWWSPDPRTVLSAAHYRVSRRLARRLRNDHFEVTADEAFAQVIRGCAAPRRGEEGTWISQDMVEAYSELHSLGVAHSIECWKDGQLAGGVYGVAIGEVFYGESMFSAQADASKVALAYLVHVGYGMVDCQLTNAHLLRLGAHEMAREQFCARLDVLCERPAVDLQAGIGHARAQLGAGSPTRGASA